MTERDEVLSLLNQLEPHAPQWVKIIRAYILKLEKETRR